MASSFSSSTSPPIVEDDEHEDHDWVFIRQQNRIPDSPDHHQELQVLFFEPAQYWVDALPLGNGKLGAMVWGGVQSELLQLNEDTLWSGGPKDWNNPEAARLLPKVRKLVWEGHFAEASALSQQMLGPYTQVYQPLGDIKLEFDASHKMYDKDSYERQLDLDTATVSVKYTTGAVIFKREIFVTYTHRVIVMKITASRDRSISFSVSLGSQLNHKTQVRGSNQLVMHGRCPGNIVPPATLEENKGLSSAEVLGKMALDASREPSLKLGMTFGAALEVQISNGQGMVQVVGDDMLRIEKANWACLVIAASSSFDGPFKDPTTTKKDPILASIDVLTSVRNISYTELLASHLQDYQSLFHRVSLQLQGPKKMGNLIRKADKGEVEKPKKTSELTNYHEKSQSLQRRLSTKERVEMFAENEDPTLVSLLFHFGRFLLLSSSRPGGFVSNLQGIWNKDLQPAFRCVPHLNINLEMNYWPAEVCNLEECHEPLFELISWLSINGKMTAKIVDSCIGELQQGWMGWAP